MQWIEKFDSRQWDVDRDETKTHVDLHFTVTGSENDLTVSNYVQVKAPRSWRGYYLQNYTLDHLGGGVWDVTCHYALSDPDESTYTFDTTGATTHITQSLSTSGRYGNAPYLGGAIGFDGDHVQGTDIQIPRYAWQETHTIKAAAFNAAYRYTLYALTSTWNNSTFRGFAVGEVQFQGARGSRRGKHDVQVTYNFEASPNLVGHSVGPISGITKMGWDYLWVRYKHTEDPSSSRVIASPDGAYVERIFNGGNFSALGIGIA